MNIHSLRENVEHLGRGTALVGMCLAVGGVCFESSVAASIGVLLLFGSSYALAFGRAGGSF